MSIIDPLLKYFSRTEERPEAPKASPETLRPTDPCVKIGDDEDNVYLKCAKPSNSLGEIFESLSRSFKGIFSDAEHYIEGLRGAASGMLAPAPAAKAPAPLAPKGRAKK